MTMKVAAGQRSAVTKPTGGGLSGEEAKARVYAQGKTLKQVASETGIGYRTLSEVVRGVNKGLYGEGHRAAVALGMKRG